MKATRKSTATPPKFHVGQRCRLVLDAKSGWPQLNGELCTITCGRRKMDLWCHDWDGSNRNLQRGTERYEITLADGSCFASASRNCAPDTTAKNGRRRTNSRS